MEVEAALAKEKEGEEMEASLEPQQTTEIREGSSSDDKLKREKEEGGGGNPLWKTSLCSYFRRHSSCSHGDACRYAHGDSELRPRPDNSWDPTSLRATKALKQTPTVTMDVDSLDKCFIGLPMKWVSDQFKAFLSAKGISYKTAKKKIGMSVGFVIFENVDQVKTAVEALYGSSTGGKQIEIADAIRRSHVKSSVGSNTHDQRGLHSENHPGSTDQTPNLSSMNENDDAVNEDTSIIDGSVSKAKSARDVVTPLAYMSYSDQLDYKKTSLLRTLKRLTRNARKACPAAVPLPDWIIRSKDIGGIPCKLEGILESPLVNGYRNKCEFSVGYSLKGKLTVGFMLGNFREGVTAVEEPVDCPNVSRIASKFALIFQEFLQSSALPSWSKKDNTGFWRQFTVREGRNPSQVDVAELLETQIAEVMLIIQVCSLIVDEELMKNEFERMAQALAQGAAAASPQLPLTTIVVQDHKGISNAAPADCPLIVLSIPKVEGYSHSEKPKVTEARIHDYICNLCFCISPTAFFQVNTLAAEALYSLAGDWADLSQDTLLFDICCGTGTIGLTLAHRVGMVVGIEMNESAVSDAHKNAENNGIKNCRFVCGKAEDVMGALLKEYLDLPQKHDIVSDTGIKCIDNDQSIANDTNDEEMLQSNACISDDVCATNACAEEIPASSAGKASEKIEILVDPQQNFEGNTNPNENRIDYSKQNCVIGSIEDVDKNQETLEGSSRFLKSCSTESLQLKQENLECGDKKNQENGTLEYTKETNADPIQQFKNIVAIVDPPRVGLHPVVIKTLRTHPRIRRLVYISCNPESLVANAIELCTPTADQPEVVKKHRGWRSGSSAGLARHRAKSMPKSEPFQPVRAVAVDLFPHTPHCEVVMLLER